MKTAVLVYGEYREFDNVVHSWKILDRLNCDFYFSTWNKSKQNNNKLKIKREFDVTPDMILKYYPDAVVDIINQKDIPELDDMWGNSVKIYYHWKNCLKLLKDSKKEYDFILIIRPDLFLTLNKNYTLFPIKLLSKIYKKNSLFMGGDIVTNNMVNDVFIFGSYDVLEKLINSSNDFIPDIHRALFDYVNNSKIEFINTDIFIKTDIVRPNVFYNINPDDALNDINYIYKKQLEWDNTVIKRPYSD